MKPMTTAEFQQYRNETKGCKDVQQIHFDVEHNDIRYNGRIDVGETDRRQVPAYYGSVVFAAIDRVNWYELIQDKKPETAIELLQSGGDSSTFQVGRASIPTFQVIGISDDPVLTIHVKGVLP